MSGWLWAIGAALVGGGVLLYEKNGSSNPAKAATANAQKNAALASGAATSSGGSLTLPTVAVQGSTPIPAIPAIPAALIQPSLPPPPPPTAASVLPTVQEPSAANNILGSLENLLGAGTSDANNVATVTGAFPHQATVTTNDTGAAGELNVRSSPSASAGVNGTFAHGDTVNITGPAQSGDGSQVGGWAPVQGADANSGDIITGFASMAFLSDDGT